MVIRAVAAALVLFSACFAQSVTPDQSQSHQLWAELKQLGATAQSLHDDLPSFTCRETAKSQLLKKNKVKVQTLFVTDLRVQRSADSRLIEEMHFTEVNGRPYSGEPFRLPVEVRGGFGDGLFVFLPAIQPCFAFTLTPGRIDFESRPGARSMPDCELAGTRHGFALLDADGSITHLEREVPPEVTHRFHLADFSSIDFVSTELGGRSYPLSSKMSADVHEDGEVKHFEAIYTDCHLYKATVTVLPGTEPVTGLTPENAPPHQ